MNLILLFETDFISKNKVRISGRRLKHIVDVHRVSDGDELEVGLLNGRIGIGRVEELTDEAVDLDVRYEREPPTPLPVTLILALPRPKVLRRVLKTVSAMGVKNIYLVNAQRVEKSYWQTPFLREDAVREQLMLGLEQARDTMLPSVEVRQRFRPFVEDELPGIIGSTIPVVADPAAAKQCPVASGQAITLAVGPEGGLIPYEIEMLLSVGFTAVSLGERVLHVEAAIPALLSRLL
jgi:RsmE family RNA methyltransferase